MNSDDFSRKFNDEFKRYSFYKGSNKGSGQFMWLFAASSYNDWVSNIKQDNNSIVKFHTQLVVGWSFLKFM